jgi:hypothetical protein
VRTEGPNVRHTSSLSLAAALAQIRAALAAPIPPGRYDSFAAIDRASDEATQAMLAASHPVVQAIAARFTLEELRSASERQLRDAYWEVTEEREREERTDDERNS